MSDGLPTATAAQSGKPASEKLITSRGTLWVFGVLGGLAVLLAAGGEGARLALRYERGAIFQGEYWRLLTGHMVHGSSAHLLLNMVGMGLVVGLFPRHYSWRQWLLILLASAAAIDAGFVFYEPQLQWYVGLSGVLHGALAAGAIAWWRQESRPLALALTLVLAAKLAWEQWHGALPFSGDMPVVVDAHLYGALGGALAGAAVWACILLFSQDWSSRRRSL
jgi:rhomboid family GlyGly-CTERM serine protease